MKIKKFKRILKLLFASTGYLSLFYMWVACLHYISVTLGFISMAKELITFTSIFMLSSIIYLILDKFVSKND